MINDIPYTDLIPENNLQELWQLSGRVDALHDFLMGYVEEKSKHEYSSNPLLDETDRTICRIMGFNDVLKIEKKEKTDGSIA